MNTQYTILIPRGTRTYTFGGVTKSDLTAKYYLLNPVELGALRGRICELWGRWLSSLLTDFSLVYRFYGLLPFTFPFLVNQSPVKSRLLRLHLRHGLADNSSATMDALSNAFSITPPVRKTHFSRVGLSEIEIEFALEPRVNYTLSVRGTSRVRDGFGLPLESQTHNFSTGISPNFFPVLDSFSLQYLLPTVTIPSLRQSFWSSEYRLLCGLGNECF